MRSNLEENYLPFFFAISPQETLLIRLKYPILLDIHKGAESILKLHLNFHQSVLTLDLFLIFFFSFKLRSRHKNS